MKCILAFFTMVVIPLTVSAQCANGTCGTTPRAALRQGQANLRALAPAVAAPATTAPAAATPTSTTSTRLASTSAALNELPRTDLIGSGAVASNQRFVGGGTWQGGGFAGGGRGQQVARGGRGRGGRGWR